MFGEAWSPMSVPDLAPDDDDDVKLIYIFGDMAYSQSTSVYVISFSNIVQVLKLPS